MNGESQLILAGNLAAWFYQTLSGINYDPEQGRASATSFSGRGRWATLLRVTAAHRVSIRDDPQGVADSRRRLSLGRDRAAEHRRNGLYADRRSGVRDRKRQTSSRGRRNQVPAY